MPAKITKCLNFTNAKFGKITRFLRLLQNIFGDKRAGGWNKSGKM